jgi:hypothetical protein
MFLLSDIITYIRRLIKTPSNSSITDSLIIDYINRFWINDVPASLQLFDLKTNYSFITQPGVDQYNMPLYSIQVESPTLIPQTIKMYPVYQGFLDPCRINGINVGLNTQQSGFYNIWPPIVQQNQAVAIGANSAGPYTIQLPILPSTPPPNPPINALLRGHIDISGIIATGNNIDPPVGSAFPLDITNTFISIPVTSMYPQVWITSIDAQGNNVIVADSGFFLNSNVNLGLLMQPGAAPFGNKPLSANVYSSTQNIVDYLTGTIYVNFPTAIPTGNNINVNCFFFQSGLPRAMLFYNKVLTLRNVPDSQFLVELTAYLTPAAFLNTSDSIQFGYMSEYIARGAARKILSDTGDIEQFQFYEPFFKEQETLVHIRSQRQWTATRTETIYSQGMDRGQMNNSNTSGGTI